MDEQKPNFFQRYRPRRWWQWALIIFIVIALGWWYRAAHQAPKYEFVTVQRGRIAQEVRVTGNITPTHAVTLSFERTGRVEYVAVGVGGRVASGQQLVQLSAGDLVAQLAQARAQVQSAQALVTNDQAIIAAAHAKLQDLQNGSRPEDIQSAQADLATAQLNVQNDYTSVPATLANLLADVENIVQVKLSSFFSTTSGATYTLAYQTCASQAQSDAQTQRAFLASDLAQWENETLTASATTSTSPNMIDTSLTAAAAHLDATQKFLVRLNDTVTSGCEQGNANYDSYRTSLAAARTILTTDYTTLTALRQAIATHRVAITKAQSALTLKQAGNTTETIAAQQAAVDQAQATLASQQAAVAAAEANVENMFAQLGKYTLRSPIAGVVTQMDAKAGQIATAGAPLAGVISDQQLEVDVNVPEVDISKVAVHDAVNITLDAVPGETFTGSVVLVDPAQTIVDGVVNYKVTVYFDHFDARFKSGLTANLSIVTQAKDNVLSVPQYAIVQNDQGTFVRVLQNGTPTDRPVTLGLTAPDGTVEITQGVTEGEQVLNVGFKSS